ncbi:hypothetical protein SAMD00019534_078830, partial [Acytostelium subglobosum LB1]|uniref:hypothetical protein n=1 Tax=Acytostelium subglobosum LB1 TaxID=1410327 RepID=UPI000644BE61
MESLSIYILQQITKQLDDDIDVACLCLTCHSLFNLYINGKILRPMCTSRSTLSTMKWSANKPILAGSLQENLLILILGAIYNLPLERNVLPSSLTSLTTGYMYDQIIVQGVLPPSLIKLVFGYHYTQPIALDVLPRSLQYLKFGHRYKAAIDPYVLPQSLHTLKFGSFFDNPLNIPGILPGSLRKLSFGYNHSQPLDLVSLPPTLISLGLGNNIIVRSTFPDFLMTLTTLLRLKIRSFLPLVDIGHHPAFDGLCLTIRFNVILLPDILIIPAQLKELYIKSKYGLLNKSLIQQVIKKLPNVQSYRVTVEETATNVCWRMITPGRALCVVSKHLTQPSRSIIKMVDL